MWPFFVSAYIVQRETYGRLWGIFGLALKKPRQFIIFSHSPATDSAHVYGSIVRVA